MECTKISEQFDILTWIPTVHIALEVGGVQEVQRVQEIQLFKQGASVHWHHIKLGRPQIKSYNWSF